MSWVIYQLDPVDADVYYGKTIALGGLEQYEQALATYEQIINLNHVHLSAYNSKGSILGNLGLCEESLAALNRPSSCFQLMLRRI